MTTVLATGGAALAMVLLTAVATLRLWRLYERPGARDGLGAIGDAFGHLIDIYDPGQAKAQRDLQHEQHRGPVAPSPDDEDDPVRLVAGPDGRPRAVRIRVRPRGA